MSIISRFTDIMGSNLNAMLDKMEDPSKMVDQYLRKAMADLAEVRAETAKVLAEETRAKAEVDNIDEDIEEYLDLTKRALQAGNREDAAVLMAKKQELEAKRGDLQSIYESAKENADAMRQMHNKLVADINTMKSRKDIVKGKASAAKAREVVNELGANSAKYGAAMGRMGEMEEKVNARYNAAVAAGQLMEQPTDEASALADKYRSGGNPAAVDSALADLEKELGLIK